jgi:hypothetical protein
MTHTILRRVCNDSYHIRPPHVRLCARPSIYLSGRMYDRGWKIACLVKYKNFARLLCLLQTARSLCPENNYIESQTICLSRSR